MLNRNLTILSIAAALTISMSSVGPAAAGSTNMTNSKTGQTAVVQCRNSGCSWSISGGSKPTQNRTGPGGDANFNKIVARLKSQGFK